MKTAPLDMIDDPEQPEWFNRIMRAHREQMIRCERLRSKPSRYLSSRNPTGMSYQKCGRKAVKKSQLGKPMCAECAKNYE